MKNKQICCLTKNGFNIFENIKEAARYFVISSSNIYRAIQRNGLSNNMAFIPMTLTGKYKMFRRCAWCKKPLGTVETDIKYQHLKITNGICSKCLKKEKRGIQG